ncbi:MAG TPA: hypothetical protein VEX11_15230 [Acetobacteraceae bacterium]|nr:hypothetical protein [Acetobacteraceae bacterium]
MMKKMRQFTAYVVYKDQGGAECEESFPIHTHSFDKAKDTALRYVLNVLRIEDFELRMVGS